MSVLFLAPNSIIYHNQSVLSYNINVSIIILIFPLGCASRISLRGPARLGLSVQVQGPKRDQAGTC